MWRSLADLDAIWVEADHPFALALAAMAALRRRGVILLIRQDTRAYFRHRVEGTARAAVGGVRSGCSTGRCGCSPGGSALRSSASHRDMALRGRTCYRSESTCSRKPSLCRRSRDTDWDELVELLTVGRIDREKNPLLVARVLAALEESDGRRFRLTWVGDGPMSVDLMVRGE